MSEKDEEMTVEGREQEPANEQQPTEETSTQPDQASDTKEFGEMEELEQVAQLEKELLAEKDKFMRLYAEFENFRRRTAKERLELIGTASSDLMKEILPVLDDFTRAVESNKEATDIDAVKAGFELLHSKLFKLLGNKGLKPIESKGKDFDPEVHEAIAQIPAPSKKEKGKILDVIENGYELNDKILRHPKVVVGT
ncbi:MAG: nucleotide exchange factor GrpE [Cryomorphaceae bacterium]